MRKPYFQKMKRRPIVTPTRKFAKCEKGVRHQIRKMRKSHFQKMKRRPIVTPTKSSVRIVGRTPNFRGYSLVLPRPPL